MAKVPKSDFDRRPKVGTVKTRKCNTGKSTSKSGTGQKKKHKSTGRGQ